MPKLKNSNTTFLGDFQALLDENWEVVGDFQQSNRSLIG